MTIYTPIGTEGFSRDLVEEALEMYDLARATLYQVISELKDEASKDKAPKEVSSYTEQHRKALETVLKERANVEQLRKKEAGIVNGYALDFVAARDEIGRRLACLRDAGGSE